MIRVINTGGTFNKRYDPLKGDLFVPADDKAVEEAIAPMRHGGEIFVVGAIYKDSLEMDDADRDLLCEIVAGSEEKRIVIVHGTDTMDQSAAAVAEWLGEKSGKCVVLTGAMVPFSIDSVEALCNLSSALTAVRYLAPGVHIAMHGLVLPYTRIRKNRERGVFEAVSE